MLSGLGYVTETNDLPVRIELVRSQRGWLDVHPVAFDADGHGTQAGPDGQFHYPPEAFTSETLNARYIPCLSVSQQRSFRSGYELRGRGPSRPGATGEH